MSSVTTLMTTIKEVATNLFSMGGDALNILTTNTVGQISFGIFVVGASIGIIGRVINRR